jgi:chromate transporter
MSTMLFGGGFVFIPAMKGIVVDSLHWIGADGFFAAIAMGQVTPGPIVITAAFIGYEVQGLAGAAVSTIAIFFTPAFFIVRSGAILQTTLHAPAVKAVLRGINPAAAGMIIAAGITIVTALLTPTIQAEALIDHHLGFWAASVGIFLATALAVLRYGVDLGLVVPASGLVGLLLF